MHSTEEQIYTEVCNEHGEERNDAPGVEKLGTAEDFQAASVKGKCINQQRDAADEYRYTLSL